MKKYFLFTVIFFLHWYYSQGQGRKIDTEIKVLTPKAGDTVISRIKGTYIAKFIIKNNGPDSIKKSDKYGIDISFGNVLYGFYFRYPSRIILPDSEDTVNVELKMSWDTDAPVTKFCGTIYITGFGIDSIKKESKSEFLNNKNCQTIAHDSRLSLSNPVLKNLFIYPNPSSGKVAIEILNTNFSPATIQLINSTGEIIKTMDITFNHATIDLSDKPKGVYFIRVFNSEFTQIQKLILN